MNNPQFPQELPCSKSGLSSKILLTSQASLHDFYHEHLTQEENQVLSKV